MPIGESGIHPISAGRSEALGTIAEIGTQERLRRAALLPAKQRLDTSALKYRDWLDVLDWATSGSAPQEKCRLFRDKGIKAYQLEG